METTIFNSLPVQYLTNPEHRIFYYYLLSSFVMAYLFFIFSKKPKNTNGFFSYFFNPKVLFHPSSRTDLYLFLFNFWVKAFLIVPIIFTQVKIIHLVKNSLESFFPTHNAIYLSFIPYSVLYTFIFFITADFSRFIIHYAFHKFSFLWEIHKVHHSAKVLTPLTLYRIHPIESIVSLARQILVVGFVAGVFSFFINGDYPILTVLGVQIFGFLFNFFGSNLRHSHVPFSFGYYLESIFISPIMHQTHHSKAYKYNSKNLGSCLAIWDILFKSYLRPDAKPIRFGLSRSQRKKNWATYLLNPLIIFDKAKQKL